MRLAARRRTRDDHGKRVSKQEWAGRRLFSHRSHGRSDRLRRMWTGLCTPPRTGGACVWQGGGKGLQGEDTSEYDTDEDALPMSDAELEEALEGLPVDVCCAEELPADISHRPMTYVVNTDTCDGPGKHWVAFHFPSTGPAEFFDSLGRSPEYYHRRFRNVLIANGPQYRFSTTQVQPGSSDMCGLFCVHFVKMRYRNISMEDIVKDFSSRDLMSNDDKLLALYE
ncbi:Hypothetical predicted protein [Mytilus galloprovincialis]|uniref:Ubiquitin-like protease family profile domain-containing protein n=1 Tax=Mytilus galloprovincialis TaxID=29158 RepID=A0A8B6HV04_MYTGA|nr:Hypothetical predicted protein [Mytilus galloprovincialis]